MSRTVRVEFLLSMPNVGSWNGRWSGEGRRFAILQRMGAAGIAQLGVTNEKPRSWYYAWSDGWGASVRARIVPTGERLPKSEGFCGYDWMVDNIVRWGTPQCQCEWRPDPNSGSYGYEGEWERCMYCSTSRQIRAPIPESAVIEASVTPEPSE